MKDLNDSGDITLIRQYLLGLLELTKQEELEQRLLADAAFLEEVLIEEDELVDDFLNNRLSSDEQVSFRKFFMSAPERQEKLKFARVLKEHIATPEPDPSSENQSNPKPSLFQSILLFLTPRDMATAFSLALALLFAGLSGLLFVRERSLRGEVEKLRAEKREIVEPVDPAKDPEAQRKLAEEQLGRIEAELVLNRQKKDELERQIAQLEADKRITTPDKIKPRTAFQTPVLAIAVRSGEGGMAEIKVPEGSSLVKIAMGLPDGEDGTYRATLLSEGEVLYSQRALPAQEVDGKRVVLFGVPIERLRSGEHRVRLNKATGDRRFVGSYDFRRVR